MTSGRNQLEAISFGVWLGSLPHKHKIVIAGNHDIFFEKHPGDAYGTLGDVHYLCNETLVIDGKVFYGSPHTPPFFDWAFMADESKLAEIYARTMPEKVDVLITHGPPYGILDPGYQADHVGSTSLYEAVKQRKVQHHVFGHLHGAGGLSRPVAFLTDYDSHGNVTESHTTYFHNVAAVDEAYHLVRPEPFEFEI